MLTLPIPLIADNASILGKVNESVISKAYSTVITSSTPTVYRLDRSGGSLSIIDDSSNAVSRTVDAWSPFGSNTIPAEATIKDVRVWAW